MGTAYIETTITAEEGGVTLFETECVAEIDYETDRGELADWHIRDFRFDETKSRWDQKSGSFKRRVVSSTWCPDDLRPVLIRYADQADIEDALYEQLRASGELTYANEALRADYRSAVL